jgi:hypothetical protein
MSNLTKYSQTVRPIVVQRRSSVARYFPSELPQSDDRYSQQANQSGWHLVSWGVCGLLLLAGVAMVASEVKGDRIIIIQGDGSRPAQTIRY